MRYLLTKISVFCYLLSENRHLLWNSGTPLVRETGCCFGKWSPFVLWMGAEIVPQEGGGCWVVCYSTHFFLSAHLYYDMEGNQSLNRNPLLSLVKSHTIHILDMESLSTSQIHFLSWCSPQCLSHFLLNKTWICSVNTISCFQKHIDPKPDGFTLF